MSAPTLRLETGRFNSLPSWIKFEFGSATIRSDVFTFQKTTQFVISACNATPSIVAVRVSNLDYRISVAVGNDRGEFVELRAPKDDTKFIWIFMLNKTFRNLQ
jgi:hypothetical protein